MPRSRSFGRVMFLGIVFAAPLLYLVAQAALDPRIEFLAPSGGAEWALAPDQRVRDPREGPVSDDVVFSREFSLSSRPERFEFEFRAFTSARLELNGAVLRVIAPANWKRASRVDLAPGLRAGRNRLAVRVHNPGSVPALNVSAPAVLRTPGDWRAKAGAGAERPAVTPRAEVPRDFEFRRGEPAPLVDWVGPGGAQLVVLAWLVLLVGAAGWALLRRPAATPAMTASDQPAGAGVGKRAVVEGAAVSSETREPTAFAPKRYASALVLAVAFGCQLWNAIHYPYQRTYLDRDNHIEYVEAIAESRRVPDPRDGFQMYQPPGYYATAAATFTLFGGGENREAALRAVQFVGAAAGFGLVALSWWLSRRLFTDEASRVVATAFAASVPMLLYCSPMISNETFAAFTIALALCFVATARDLARASTAAVAGVLCALALLSKYTALFTVVATALLLVRRSLFDGVTGAKWRSLAAFVTPIVVLSGWLYARNLLLFGDAFVGNWDPATGFAYEQDPGYRTPNDYLAFGRLFLQPMEHAPWLSWPDGIYASMWSDPFQSFLNPGDPRLPRWVAVALLLALWPSLLIGVGFADSVRRAWLRPFADLDSLLVSVVAWSLTALLSFSLEVPFYSTVKAFFALSLVPIFGAYLARGRNLVAAGSRSVRIGGDVLLVALAVINLTLYRYPSA